MSGIIGGAKSKSGIVGSAAVVAEKNSWHLWASDSRSIANAVLDFDGVSKLGSRCTESAGRVTVLDGGLYWIAATIHKYNNTNNTTDMVLRIGGTAYNGTRILIANTTTNANWEGESGAWAIPLIAGQVVDMYGSAYHQGAGSPSASTCFSGVRIGA
mgnify:FL=1|jgi:hypothetical protein|tara:strand:- start:380 stop:850 length:471 start_codon:yes stop_codon:yes gene_type:complete